MPGTDIILQNLTTKQLEHYFKPTYYEKNNYLFAHCLCSNGIMY